MEKQKVYISGPMTGWPRNIYMRKFGKVEQILRRHGYDTINPCRVWSCRWPWLYRIVGYELTLLYDMWLIMKRADRMYYIPGWSYSRGCQLEFSVAMRFGKHELNIDLKKEIDQAVNNL